MRADSILTQTEVQAVALHHQALTAFLPERWLYTNLVEACAQKSRVMFALADSSAEPTRDRVTVQYKITALELHYRKLRKPGWFRPGPVQRTARIVVDFDLRATQTQRIYFQGALEETSRDTLQNGVEQLENSAMPFTIGVWQQNDNRRAWLEPVLLTAATGAIVYAFYSLRSQ